VSNATVKISTIIERLENCSFGGILSQINNIAIEPYLLSRWWTKELPHRTFGTL